MWIWRCILWKDGDSMTCSSFLWRFNQNFFFLITSWIQLPFILRLLESIDARLTMTVVVTIAQWAVLLPLAYRNHKSHETLDNDFFNFWSYNMYIFSFLSLLFVLYRCPVFTDFPCSCSKVCFLLDRFSEKSIKFAMIYCCLDTSKTFP